MALSLIEFFGGLMLGFFIGIGSALFYLRWKMQSQLGALQNEMQDVMDLTGEMAEDFDPEEISMEEVEKEENEREN